MRTSVWLAAGAAVAVACGGGANPGGGSAGPGGGGPVARHLSIHVAGSGTVQGASFACDHDCSQSLTAAVQLSAAPAAGWVFAGWQGSCSGMAACNLPMNADAEVTATFTAMPPTPVMRTLTVTVNGPGSVTSAPAGISCPGTCSAPFADGTRVTLAAEARPGDQFSNWAGACSGSRDCSLSLSADASVTAMFGAFLQDECAEVVPASLGTPIAGTVDFSGPKNSCDTAITDRQGNVAAMRGGIGPDPWTLWTSAGDKSAQHIDSFRVVPQPSGFQGVDFDSTRDERTLAAFGPDGALLRQTDIAPASALNWIDAFGATTGGSVVLSLACRTGIGAGMALQVIRFDASGGKVSDASFAGAGCVASNMAALSDDLDHTLVVLDTGGAGGLGFGPNKTIARWLDRGGTTLTDWFEVASAAATPVPLLRPLAGGGAILGSVGPVWHASLPSAKATSDDAPAFAQDHADLRIVRGGKAYAVVPTSDASIDLHSVSGKRCGTLQFPGARRLQVGLDGTVIDLGGSDGCSLRWWPQLLK